MADEIIVNRKYRIVRQIGVGGMGAVYEVEHVRLRHVRYALKQLKRELEREKDLADRFDKEAMRMAELQHPNIVRVYDIDVDPDFGAFILMDLIQGSNLSAIIREQGRRPLVEVVRIGSEIASALDFAHSKGIVHRDIKPGNILIENGTGRAVLTDFGIAKKIQKEGDETDGTRTGVFVGTYRYASPEQMRNEEPDPRWDVYSFGIVLYEAISGKRFLDKMAEGQIFAHVAYMPDWKPQLDYGEAPDAMRQVIEHCLERDREARIANAAELGRRLQACLGKVVDPSAPSPAPPPATAPGPPAPLGGVLPGVEPVEITPPPLAADSASAVTAVERYDARRAELRARAEERLGVVERLERIAESMGLRDWPSGDDVRASLAAITELEDSSQYEEAMRRLESAGERGTEVRQSMEQFIRQTLASGVADLRARWDDLGERARQLVPAADAGEVGRALATAEERVDSGDWTAGWENLTKGRRVVDRIEEAAIQQARAKVDVALDAIRTQVEQLAKLGAAVPAEIDPRQVGERLAGLIDAGRLGEADRQSTAVLARARQQAEEARKSSEERIKTLRARILERTAQLDLEEAGAVAPAEIEKAKAAERDAAEAERHDDPPATAAALDVALGAYEAAGAAIEADLAKRAGALEQAVGAALAAAERLPAPLVAAARDAARASLESAKRGDRRAALVALDRARTGLDAVTAEAPLYAEAIERGGAAEAARASAQSAGVAKREQGPAERLMQEARGEIEARHWEQARDRFARAAEAWSDLEAAAKERDAVARVASRREAIEARLQELVELERAAQAAGIAGLERFATEPIGDRLTALTDVPAEKAQDALSELADLEKQIGATQASIEQALRAGLTKDVSALAGSWDEIAERAGRFLAGGDAQDVARRLDAVRKAAGGRDTAALVPLPQALQDLRERIKQGRSAAESNARSALADLQKEIAATHGGLAGEAKLGAGLEPAAIEERASELIAEGRLLEGYGEAERALGALRQARAELDRAYAEQLAAARRAFDEAAAAADGAAVRAAATTEFERAERAGANARQAEKRDARAAITAYEEGRAAYDGALRAWKQRRRERVEQLGDTLRAGTEKAAAAPAVVVGDALAAARRALEAAAEADPDAAIRELESAGRLLDGALADVPRYEAAQHVRAEAESAAEKVASLPAPEREAKAARKAMQSAAAELEAKHWAEAERGYGEARGLWLAVETKAREIAKAAEEEARLVRALKERLAALVASIGSVPADLDGGALTEARELGASADAARAALEKAVARLESLAGELPLLRAAHEQRESAQATEQRVVAMGAKRKQIKEPRRLMAEAEAAFGKRAWGPAGEAFGAALRAWSETEQKLRQGEVVIEETPRALPTRAIAIAAGLVLMIGAGIYFATQGGVEPAKIDPKPVAQKPVEQKPIEQKPIERKPAERKPDEPIAAVAPAPRAEGEVASVEKPAPAPVPPLAFTSPVPAAERVRVKEGAKQEFSIATRGGPAGAAPALEWSLDGEVVASDAGNWEWAPGFDAARDEPHRLEVSAQSGGEEATHRWDIEVENVDRAAKIVESDPPEGKKISKKRGEKVKLRVEANDADGDPLRYAWTVDGKPAGQDGPTLEVEVGEKDKKIALAVRGGESGEPATADWEIASLPPEIVKLALDASPRSLTRLAFAKPATFKLTPKGSAPPGLTYEWRVDGKKVADGPSFEFRNADESLVRKKPVQIAAVVRAEGFDDFTYDWKVEIAPPAPEITSATPSAGRIDAAAGESTTFEIDAAAPVGEQKLTYVFVANGKKTESSAPTFRLPSSSAEETTVVASVRDNFGQRSAEKRWTVKRPAVARIEPTAVPDRRRRDSTDVAVIPPAPPPAPPAVPSGGVESSVQSWLDRYRAAFNSKDVDTLAGLLRLDSGKKKALADALSKKDDLRVTLSNIQTTNVGDGTARVSYNQLEQFTDRSSGRSVSLPTQMTRTFRVRGGVAELQK